MKIHRFPVLFASLFCRSGFAGCAPSDTPVKSASRPNIRFIRKTIISLLCLPPVMASGNKPTPVDRFHIADGLEANVWAQAPLLFNPTNLDADSRGRIWATEAVNYRSFRNEGEVNRWHKDGDRVMVLEDTDKDGRADASHVFVQDKDLVAPMGLSVLDNRVIVTCSPSIIVYTDVDRDARFDPAVDKKEILLTGFGGFDHDHSLHTVKAGPDGDLYFTTGNAGPHVVTDRSGWTLRAGSSYRGGSPSNNANVPGLISDDGRMYVGGIAGRMRPDGTGLRIIGHNFRNPYELCLDSFGNVFQNDNDDTISCRTTWVMEYGNLGFSSRDGERTWRADHRPGQTTPVAHWRQEDPGIIPTGDVYGPGSPTGIEYYENGSLGPAYENMLLSAEAGRNLIWMYFPEPRGAGYELRRSTLFSTSPPDSKPRPMDKEDTRKWFRPSDVLAGADGAIYIADFYDPFIGGHRMLEPDGMGTVYRITRKGSNPQPPPLNLNTTGGLIEALQNPAHSVRHAGFLGLTGAPNQSIVKALIQLSHHANARFAARAMYALAEIGKPVPASAGFPNQAWLRVLAMLEDANPELRIAAFRAVRKLDPKGLVDYADKLKDDPADGVRRELLLALRDVPFSASKKLILELAQSFNGRDRWYLEAFGTACEGRETAVWKVLLQRADPDPLQWNEPFSAITWRLHPEAAVEPLRTRALSGKLNPDQRKQAIDALAFVPTEAAGRAVLEVAINGPEDLRGYARWWVRSRSSNTWKAFKLVALLPPDPEAERLAGEERQIIRNRNKLKGAAKPSDEILEVAAEMAKSPIGASHLIHLAGRNELPAFVYPVIGEYIHQNSDLSVRAMASRYFPNPAATTDNLPALGDIANMDGEAAKGRALFFGKAACFTCHLHGSEGRDIGPNLTEVGQRFDRLAILDSILNPSAAIAFGYEAEFLETAAGQSYSGFVVGEGETLILKDIAGQLHTIPTSEIRKRTKLDQSIMPSGSALNLSARELADLLTFLTRAP